MSDGEARRIHSSRPLAEREQDELRTEILVNNLNLWLSDIDKFDMARVDDKSPLIFYSSEHPTENKLVHAGEIVAKDEEGKEVGHITYSRHPCAMHLDMLYVDPKYYGKGYTIFMMREFIDMQDHFCTTATLEPVPYGVVAKEEIGKKEWGKKTKVLHKLYQSFGFDFSDKKGFMIRNPVCRTEKEKENLKKACENIDLEELSEFIEGVSW
jgi:GNAT superfamily N-acetyltransferase